MGTRGGSCFGAFTFMGNFVATFRFASCDIDVQVLILMCRPDRAAARCFYYLRWTSVSASGRNLESFLLEKLKML